MTKFYWDKVDSLLYHTKIPYQELLGNYDSYHIFGISQKIIPYQELLGNYDDLAVAGSFSQNYTIPRAIREL